VPIRRRDEIAALPGKLSIRTGTTTREVSESSSFHMKSALRCRRGENHERHNVRLC
jgi:hypothetical protein